MATPDLTPQIETAADGPKRAEADGLLYESQSIADMIAADRYVKAAGGVNLPLRGMRISKLISPGAQ